ncbi:thiamine pyrophosphate-dependent enzyme [Hyphomicrobiales bacterium FT118]|uniref:Thiamine pyrophosphate-dependent enzyme n=2 Tax=Futiania mangrovi TaxID=2959716 RepID=A0A9J6PGJ3_9PROT|nr:thiamine pyrophosphate-dependent enzyme [Futiania mangrovii]
MTTAHGIARRPLVAGLLKDRPEGLLVVTGLGSPTYDVAAAGDDPRNFYLWGAMGSAVTVGLGLALAQPEGRVLVITGDGELLMALGALATVGVQGPRNLAVCVLDNERYGETGGQASHTGSGVDIPAVATACGFREVRSFGKSYDIEEARRFVREAEGPVLASFKIDPAEQPRVMPPRDGHHLRTRFRQALLGNEAGLTG